MKTILVIAAAFGLSAGAALADCAGHTQVMASVNVDREITTASIQTEKTATSEDVLVRKGARLGETPPADE